MRIGTVQLSSPFCQAGLAGYSDRAMRLVARRRGCSYAVTEALLDTIMLNGGRGLARSIDINDEDHPIAGQIIGSEPGEMARAAVILHKAGYDVVDLNFACPVKKIKNKARGGHMLQDVPRAVSIVRAVRDALPDANLTVSMRRGFDDSAQSADRFNQILETIWENNFAAVRIHGRTVEQKYHGPADWESIRAVKARYPDRVILGSGDVFTAEDAVRMKQATNVDIVWIARGAIGNPWIFRHAAALLQAPTVQLAPPAVHEQRDALIEHFRLAMELHGEQLAGRRMRKIGIKYARFHPSAAAVKKQFIAVSSMRQWQLVLDQWYSGDAPGVWPDPKAADEVNDDASCEAA